MSTDRSALITGSVSVDKNGKSASIATNKNERIAWQALTAKDPRAAAAAVAHDQAEGMIRTAGERRDIRNSTILKWAASLAAEFVSRGLDVQLAGSYGSTYAHTIAALPVGEAFWRAAQAGLEPDIPTAGELERMATVAERGHLTSAAIRIEEIKAITIARGPAAAQVNLDQVLAQYPQLMKKQGFTINTYEAGAVVAKEAHFSTFQEAVAAFRELPTSMHPRLCEHDRPLLWHNTEGEGPALKFANDKVQNAYFDSLLNGIGSISISSNLVGKQCVHQTVQLAPGSADKFRTTLAAVGDNVHASTQEIEQGNRPTSQPRLGR